MNRIESYIRLAIIIILFVLVLYLPILFVLKRKEKSAIRQLSYIGLFCSLFIIIFATILYVRISLPPKQYFLNLIPFNWTSDADAIGQLVNEKIPNILLFVPLGFFIPAVFRTKRKLYKIVIISFCITFSVEFIQYFIGRLADIDDIITNVLGGIIGYQIFQLINRIFINIKIWQNFIGGKKYYEQKEM